MNIKIYDQYSKLAEAVNFHTGKLGMEYQSLSSIEYVKESDLTEQEAYDAVENIVLETEVMGTDFEAIKNRPGYAEVQVFLEEFNGVEGPVKLYRVIFTQ